MSTRACYTFVDDDQTLTVYKHQDGYPEGAVQWIAAGVKKAWPLPRFEAADMIAAFVAANKPDGGGIYLCCPHGPDGWKHHGDLDYHYEISADDTTLMVRVYKLGESGAWRQIFRGSLGAMQKRYGG